MALTLSLSDSEYENLALHNFFIHVSLPIIASEDDKFFVIGTGTLFKIAGRHFLITAAHILESYAPDRWAYPTGPHEGEIRTFGTGEFFKPNDGALDICVVELKDKDAIAHLEKGWRFLTLENVWLPDMSADAVFLSGFPSERALFENGHLRGRLFVVRSQYRIDRPNNPNDPPVRGVDFYVHYVDSVNELSGENVSDVSIQGTSGCSIWAYRKSGWTEHNIWSPEVVLKVIGVQSAYAHNNYLRCKSWGTVLLLLAELDGDIRNEVQKVVEDIKARVEPIKALQQERAAREGGQAKPS